MDRSRARARVACSAQGQPRGRCKVSLRAERVSRPVDGQPGGVGGETARREMIESHAVLEVSDGILDLGVAAMVGLQFQGIAVQVGDEAVIAVAGEQGQLGTGGWASLAGR